MYDCSIDGYISDFCNAGRGKGLASYSECTFQYQSKLVQDQFQLTKFSTTFDHWSGKTVNMDVISLYRSTGNKRDAELIMELSRLIDHSKICCCLLNTKTQTMHVLCDKTNCSLVIKTDERL